MNENEFHEKIKSEIAKIEQVIKAYKGMTQTVSPDVAIGRISRIGSIQNKILIRPQSLYCVNCAQ